MRELTERARASIETAKFSESLSADQAGAFDNIVPIANDAADAHEKLQRCRFEAVSHHQLTRSIEDRVPALIQRADGGPVDPPAVRLLLQEFAWSHLGQVVTPNDVVAELGTALLGQTTARRQLAGSGSDSRSQQGVFGPDTAHPRQRGTHAA